VSDLLQKIEEAGLVGRGGAGYPTHLKWKAMQAATGPRKMLICNASEGEIGVYKDLHILKTDAERVFEGMRLAMDFLGSKEAYINLNIDYYHQIGEKIDALVAKFAEEGYKIKLYKEKPTYPGGEETALLNNIEGKRLEPRLKPPYPSEFGLFGLPTLVQNVETLYDIALVNEGKFEGKRFCCIQGAVRNSGVYHVPNDWSANKVLTETDNLPVFDYFVQVGGGASGVVFNQEQAETEKLCGAGSIEVYKADRSPSEVLKKWFDFFAKQSCGKCTPCREGCYQLQRMLQERKSLTLSDMESILQVLEETSFCGLGKSLPVAVRS
jgi:NADH:ubiquinone oxidoreductase subunit F (NADH-binding)